MPNTLEKYKKWILVDMIETYKKILKKNLSEPGSQPKWTNQTHDSSHEIGMTP